MYITREIERTVEELLSQYKVVLVTGARQVGKTTLLEESQGSRFNYVSLENPTSFSVATQDALLFFENNALPLIVDEVQRAPQLFSTIKFLVDQSDEYGKLILTGSQTYRLMKGVSESLAGRIGILEMSGLSLREILGRPNPHPYVPIHLNKNDICPVPDNFDLWRCIHRGSMPALVAEKERDWDRHYSDYMQTYLERDVRDLINVKDEMKFYDFVVACAARTGNLFNASSVAEVVGIDHKTAQSWLSVLQASGIVRIVRPIWANSDKRLSKMSKLYFMDTGLVCYLTRWTTPEQLQTGAVAGQIFETFVVSEILKSYLNAGANIRDIWFYRDSQKHEIDLVLQEGRVLHPVEIKKAMSVGGEEIKQFSFLETLQDYTVGEGAVICQTKDPYPISENVQAVPVWAI